MTQRFRVIQGGLSEDRAPDAEPTVLSAWRVELKAASEIDGDTQAAWRALTTREPDATSFDDPDYLLPAAQHRTDGHNLVFALAWSRGEDTDSEALRGVVPLSVDHAVWGRGRARHWQAQGTDGESTGLIEARYADEVAAALRQRLEGSRRPLTLAAQERIPADEPGRPVLKAVPDEDLVGIGRKAASETETVSDPARIRDAVETFLGLDARASQKPIVADPSDAAMVRVVSRLFARRRQASVELVRRGGEVVSGALRLGSGAKAVTWRQASLESERA